MTKPKKWYLERNGRGVVLKNEDNELLKKRNAKQALGRVMKVEVPDADNLRKFSVDESVLVS